ncbi:MAG: protein translocase subunit SecF [Thermoleophilia bacterium]|nr:protein translocase subunit SecF [Thermoleophilia bacterium]
MMLPNFDFMGKKKLWFAVTAVVFLISVGSLSIRGLNLGIDFTSGNRLVVSFGQEATVDEMREIIGGLGYGEPVVQTIGEGRYQVTLPTLTAEEEAGVVSALDERFGVQEVSWKSVGPTFGRQVVNAMVQAVIAAWVLLIIYATVRFEYKMAVAILAAVVHDLILTGGIYSLVGREVTTATVAAILTIMGFSLYDTVIVFDRVRENAPKAKRGTYGEMVNQSIREVLARSIITTVIVLMPVLSLLFFGGETLKDFAFALTIGIASGTYSSLFVASPLLALWKERERRYRASSRPARAKA